MVVQLSVRNVTPEVSFKAVQDSIIVILLRRITE